MVEMELPWQTEWWETEEKGGKREAGAQPFTEL